MPLSETSTALDIFSVSTSITSSPDEISSPTSINQAATVPSFMESPHFGMQMARIESLIRFSPSP